MSKRCNPDDQSLPSTSKEKPPKNPKHYDSDDSNSTVNTTCSEPSTQESTVDHYGSELSVAKGASCGLEAARRVNIEKAGPPLAHFPAKKKKKKRFNYPRFLARITRKSKIKEAQANLLENEDINETRPPLQKVSVTQTYCKKVVRDFSRYCRDAADSVLQVWTSGKDRSPYCFEPIEAPTRHIRSMEELLRSEKEDETLDLREAQLSVSLDEERPGENVENPDVVNLRQSLRSLTSDLGQLRIVDEAQLPNAELEMRRFETGRSERLDEFRARIQEFRDSLERHQDDDELKDSRIEKYFPEVKFPVSKRDTPPNTPE